MPDLAYLNGKFMPIEQARVPIEDRGYQFADGVYEYIASYEGRLFRLEAHLDRLERGLSELGYAPIPRPHLHAAIVELFQRAGYARAGIYIQITRGVAPRNHAFAATLAPQIVMTVREIKAVPADPCGNGIQAITVRDLRWGRCDIKTTQLLANCLAKQKALASGYHDAIFVSDEDIVREGTSSNLFVVHSGRVTTHPLTPHILPGITRMVILETCGDLGLGVSESFFTTQSLYQADEAFLTGTVTEVLPVVGVDGRTIANGGVGPITRRLYAALREKALGPPPS